MSTQSFNPIQIYITTHGKSQFTIQYFKGLSLSMTTEACSSEVSRWVGRPIMGLRHKDKKEIPKSDSPVNIYANENEERDKNKLHAPQKTRKPNPR